jgi:nucleoside-diphosphate-sugar epimerase
VVTGGCGFLGSYLVKMILDAGAGMCSYLSSSCVLLLNKISVRGCP